MVLIQGGSLAAINNEASKNLFVASGRSLKGKNEIHLLEYNFYLGSMACHQVFNSPFVVNKLGEDRETPGTYFIAGKDGSNEVFCVARAAVDSLREAATREELYKLTKDALTQKSQLKPVTSAVFPFRIRE